MTTVLGREPGPLRAGRVRLAQVDAMRPIKQAGVIATHALLIFGPSASVACGAALLVTHVTRFAFMFISAAMLVYAYPRLHRAGLPTFWRRRLLAVAIPYMTWTLVYFVVESVPLHALPATLRPTPGLDGSVLASVLHLGQLMASGYYQLYYLLVLMQFYLIYPVFLWLLRRTARHHGTLLGASLAVEIVLVSIIHWGLLPAWLRGGGANRELWNYQLYVVAGGLMAWHYQDVDSWLRRRWRLVLGATVIAAAVAEGWYLLAALRIFGSLGGDIATEPFQPVVVPLYLGLIASVYLLGASLTDSRMPARTGSWLASAGDNSYGIYLNHMLVMAALAVFGWQRLETVAPWPVVIGGAIVIVYLASAALTSALTRLPGARATTGRARSRTRLVTGAQRSGGAGSSAA